MKRVILPWLEETALRRGDTECIEFPFALSGRGRRRALATVGGRRVQATHVILELSGRPRPGPPNNHAMHLCDNPPCMNPDHLAWGSARQNNQDGFARGLLPTGEKHPNSKLTESDVITIRERSAAGETAISIAADFGIADSYIPRIVRGTAWSRTPMPDVRRRKKK